MAAAEVRAAWQRTVNRCFIQEDAKRAPKLACCQPSCAASRSVEAGPAGAADEFDHAAVNVTTFNRKPSFSNLTPDSRWWLHLQPNCGFQKGSTYEELNALEDEVEISKVSDEYKAYKGDAKYDTLDIDSVGCSVSKQENDFSVDSDYSWIEGGGKSQPWWQTTDRDELASFVSRRSLDHIENCDLPPPQKYLRGQPCADISNDKMKTASFDLEAKSSGFSELSVQSKRSLDSRLMCRNRALSADKGNLCFACDKSSRYTTVNKDVTEQVFKGNPSKAQLMEALRRSQTRAREAEEAAKLAYAEKEHIITLFFKQASQLFAYKQWFQILLLENFHIQRNSSFAAMALPWMSFEGTTPRKRKHKFSNGEQEMAGKTKGEITTYEVAFALGLSLVGAGLLLGWSVGWMLPRL